MRPVLRLALAIAAVAGGLVQPGVAVAQSGQAPGANFEPGPVAIDRLAECIATRRQLAVVLLMDESGSLSRTDPEAARVDAAIAVLNALLVLAEAPVDGAPPKVDVLVAGFAADYDAAGEWSALSRQGIDDLAAEVQPFADRDDKMDTDYYHALEGADRALQERVQEIDDQAPKGVCQVVLWFTDGGYLIGQRTKPEEVERYGSEKDYAPGVSLRSKAGATEARDIGRSKLCEPEGLADRLRQRGVFNFAIALRPEPSASDDIDPDDFLEALTTGSGSLEECGDPDSEDLGAYLPADDVGSLPDKFLRIVCEIQGCVTTGSPFVVDGAFGRALITADGAEGGSVILRSPSGEALTVDLGQDQAASIGSTEAVASALGESGSLITLDFDMREDDHLGTWDVELVGPGSGELGGTRTAVYLYSGIAPTIQDDAYFELGVPRSIDVSLVDEYADPLSPLEVEGQLEVSSAVIDPATGERLELEAGPLTDDGTATVTYTAPVDLEVRNLRVAVRVGGTAGGGLPLSPTVRTFAIPVVKDSTIPRVLTDLVTFPPLRQGQEGQADRTESTGAIELLGSDVGDATACITGVDVRDRPPRLGTVSVEERCIEVPRGERVSLPVALSIAELKTGAVAMDLALRLEAEQGGATDEVPVPGAVETFRGVDVPVAILLVILIVASSVLLPLLILWCWNWHAARFRSNDLFFVRRLGLPVRVSDGSVLPADEEGPLLLPPGGGAYLEQYSPRRVEIGLSSADASTPPVVVTPLVHLFALPQAVASWNLGGVVGEHGLARRRRLTKERPRGIISHSLFDTWLFAIDSASPSQDGEVVDAVGDLVLLVDDHPAWEDRAGELLGDASAIARQSSVVKAVDRLHALGDQREEVTPREEGDDEVSNATAAANQAVDEAKERPPEDASPQQRTNVDDYDV